MKLYARHPHGGGQLFQCETLLSPETPDDAAGLVIFLGGGTAGRVIRGGGGHISTSRESILEFGHNFLLRGYCDVGKNDVSETGEYGRGFQKFARQG